jgi:hypothetical protein
VQQFEACMDTLRAAAPRHQFIADSHAVRIIFSKCYIQLQIKNSGGNLYSYIGRYRNYGKWKAMCIKTAIIVKQAALDLFSLWRLPRDWSLRERIVSCMDAVSCCTTHCCANLFDRVWIP